MATKAHSLVSIAANHPVNKWAYANAAARTGATGFVATDLNTVAHQQDNDTYWILTATTPTWLQVATGGPAGGFTQGSVIFASATGSLAEDNSEFFWDNFNSRLGIGTASPQNKLHVYSSSTAAYQKIQTGAAFEVSLLYTTPSGSSFVGQAGAAGNIVVGSLAGDYIVGNRTGAGIILSTNVGRVDARMDSSGNMGIGVSAPNTKLDVQGGMTHKVTSVNGSTYDLLNTDYIVHVIYTASGAVTSLTLPTAQTVSGRTIVIKDAGGNASANNITVDTQASETIDGAATAVMNADYEWLKLYSDGSDWFIIGN